LDLYVVLKNDTEKRELDAMLEIVKAISRKKSMPVDILAAKKNHFLERKEAPTLERQIEQQGIKFMDKKEAVKEWFDIADKDLALAGLLPTKKNKPALGL
jgi:hypothetical protein